MRQLLCLSLALLLAGASAESPILLPVEVVMKPQFTVGGCEIALPKCEEGSFLIVSQVAGKCPIIECQQCGDITVRAECIPDGTVCPAITNPKCSAKQFVFGEEDPDTTCPKLTCRDCTTESMTYPGCRMLTQGGLSVGAAAAGGLAANIEISSNSKSSSSNSSSSVNISSNNSSSSTSVETSTKIQIALFFNIAGCTIQQVSCPANMYTEVLYRNNECPYMACTQCTASAQRKECRDSTYKCPKVQDPGCGKGQFVLGETDPSTQCPRLVCRRCTQETARYPGCSRSTDCPAQKELECKRGFYQITVRNAEGCDISECERCSAATAQFRVCQSSCPVVAVPKCARGSYLVEQRDANRCIISATCKICDAESNDRPECRTCPEINMPVCTMGTYVKTGRDENACVFAECAKCTKETRNKKGCECPSIDMPRCAQGYFVQYSETSTGCPRAACEVCTEETKDKPGCKKVLCPLVVKPKCERGSYLVTTTESNGCLSRRCELCNELSKDKVECKLCPQLDVPNCPMGTYVQTFRDSKDCPMARCAKCSEETREKRGCECPQVDMPNCPLGSYVKYSKTSTGCPVAACETCTEMTRNERGCEVCPPVVMPRCKKGSYLVETTDSKGCLIKATCKLCDEESSHREECRHNREHHHCAEANKPVCTGTSTAVHHHEGNKCRWVCRPALCKQQPQKCAPGFYRAALKEEHVLNKCTPWQCRVCDFDHRHRDGCVDTKCRQVIDWQLKCKAAEFRSLYMRSSTGCMAVRCTKCSEIMQSQYRWFQLPDECLNIKIPPTCPNKKWLPAPTEIGTELVQIGKCSFTRFVFCPKPRISCHGDNFPVLVSGCNYKCKTLPIVTPSRSHCFEKPGIFMFLIDISEIKSAFQVKFQAAAFIANFAKIVKNIGKDGTRIGAIIFHEDILDIVTPDECNDMATLTRRLLHLKIGHTAQHATAGHQHSTAHSMGKVLQECGKVIENSVNSAAVQKSMILVTSKFSSRDLVVKQATARLQQLQVKRYFVSISSVFNQELLAAGRQFASPNTHVLMLPAWQLLATNGVKQLFPACSQSCRRQQRRVEATLMFLQQLQSRILQYESMLLEAERLMSVVQESVSTVQYRYETKQIRLRMCTVILELYKKRLGNLEEKLKSMKEVISKIDNSEEMNKVELEQVRDLNRRAKMLAKRIATLKIQKKAVKTVIEQVEERMEQERKTNAARIAAERILIKKQETEISQKWKVLQEQMQLVASRRVVFTSQKTIKEQKIARINSIMELKEKLRIRISTFTAKINQLKNSTDSKSIRKYETLQQQLKSCKVQAELQGFTKMVSWKAGSGVKLQEVVQALRQGKQYSWLRNSSSIELQQLRQLRNFTVGTYDRVKLVMRNSLGKQLVRLTFKTAASDFNSFFTSRNLIDSFPWSLATVKESLKLNWATSNNNFQNLLFSTTSGKNCSTRRALFCVLAAADPCRERQGPFPRFFFSESLSDTTIQELSEATTVEILGKRLVRQEESNTDADYVTTLVASEQMPVDLQQILRQRMLNQPASAWPRHITQRTFFKSRLLSNPAFKTMRLRLIDENNGVHDIEFDKPYIPDSKLVNSTWSLKSLLAAGKFVSTSALQLLIGSASPCANPNSSGFVYLNPGTEPSCQLLPLHAGWAGLVSRSSTESQAWSEAAKVKHVIVMMRRHQFLPSTASLELPQL